MKKTCLATAIAAGICVACLSNSVSAATAATAKEIMLATPGAPNGVYSMDFDGAGPSPVRQIYANMTTSGGGWTLLAASTASGLSAYDFFGTGDLNDFINSYTGWSFMFDLNSQFFFTTSSSQQFQDWEPGTSFGTPGANIVMGEILAPATWADLPMVFNEEAVTFNQAANWKIYGREGAHVIPSHVPEPETWALMLAGLGLMGFVARRRMQV